MTEPFSRLIPIGKAAAQTDWWVIFSIQTPSGEGQAAVERQAYEALVGCAYAHFDGNDAADNALLELEVELEKKYRAQPSRTLTVTHEEMKPAIARYLPQTTGADTSPT